MPVTAAGSELLVAAKLEPLTTEEDTSWRKAAAKVAEKYLSYWILPELIFVLVTTSIALKRCPADSGIRPKLICIGAGIAMFAGLMVAKARLEKAPGV